MVYIDDLSNGGFSKNPLLDSQNSRWRRSAIVKIVISQYLNEKKTSNFDKIWYIAAHLELDDSHVIKYYFLLNSRWRMTAIFKTAFGHPIAGFIAKFCTGKQNSMAIEVT